MYEGRCELDGGRGVFVFLPLAHVLARVTQLVAIDVGGTVVYWSGDAAALLEDVAASRPTHLPSVPRLFEKIHTKALAAGRTAPRQAHSSTGRSAGRRACGRGIRPRPGAAPRAKHALADRLVLVEGARAFGDRLQIAVTGAAPISRTCWTSSTPAASWCSRATA